MNLFKLLPLLLILNTSLAWAQNPVQISLWEKGAPGFENLRDIPEQSKDYWVKNINNPSITAYFPKKELANGTAIVLCPGGGHRLLVYNSEGVEPAKFFNTLGITVFVLKYRLARDTNSPYTIEIHARQDGERAMKLVRSRAREWGLNPNKIGMMGFSAGGEVVDLVSFNQNPINPKNPDPVDKETSIPNFIIQIYPGPLFIPDSIPPHSPPAFLLAANDDLCCSVSIIRLLAAYRKSNIPVETHIYAQGNHAFNMGYRSKLLSIHSWPQRLSDWLQDNGYLKNGHD